MFPQVLRKADFAFIQLSCRGEKKKRKNGQPDQTSPSTLHATLILKHVDNFDNKIKYEKIINNNTMGLESISNKSYEVLGLINTLFLFGLKLESGKI